MTGSLSIFLPDGDSPNTDSLNTLAATITSTASANLDVSVVVPTFREVENLTTLTEQLFAALHERSLTGELIVVDDNSCDGTIELCQRLAETYPIRLVVRTEERGLATAVIRGFSEASGTYVVVMDADLSHPPTAVPTLLETLQTNQADFVIGSRYVKGGTIDESWSIFRRINS
ncbi:MAG: glycosyltransferase, partial [Fuerstiella sp.]